MLYNGARLADHVFHNVLQRIQDKGCRGFVGLEHGNSDQGKEVALAAPIAYRSIDPK